MKINNIEKKREKRVRLEMIILIWFLTGVNGIDIMNKEKVMWHNIVGVGWRTGVYCVWDDWVWGCDMSDLDSGSRRNKDVELEYVKLW